MKTDHVILIVGGILAVPMCMAYPLMHGGQKIGFASSRSGDNKLDCMSHELQRTGFNVTRYYETGGDQHLLFSDALDQGNAAVVKVPKGYVVEITTNPTYPMRVPAERARAFVLRAYDAVAAKCGIGAPHPICHGVGCGAKSQTAAEYFAKQVDNVRAMASP